MERLYYCVGRAAEYRSDLHPDRGDAETRRSAGELADGNTLGEANL